MYRHGIVEKLVDDDGGLAAQAVRVERGLLLLLARLLIRVLVDYRVVSAGEPAPDRDYVLHCGAPVSRDSLTKRTQLPARKRRSAPIRADPRPIREEAGSLERVRSRGSLRRACWDHCSPTSFERKSFRRSFCEQRVQGILSGRVRSAGVKWRIRDSCSWEDWDSSALALPWREWWWPTARTCGVTSRPSGGAAGAYAAASRTCCQTGWVLFAKERRRADGGERGRLLRGTKFPCLEPLPSLVRLALARAFCDLASRDYASESLPRLKL